MNHSFLQIQVRLFDSSKYMEMNRWMFCLLGSLSQYGVTGMLHASTSIFFAYVGFESVTAVAQEADTPSRTIPLALISSLIISILLYVGVSTVMVGLVPYTVLNTQYPLATAV